MGQDQTFYSKSGQKLDIPEMGLFFQEKDAYIYMYRYLLYIVHYVLWYYNIYFDIALKNKKLESIFINLCSDSW